MIEEMMLANQILFCFILGAIGGVIKLLNFDHGEEFELSPISLLRQSIVSGVVGLVTYFFTFDMVYVTPHKRLGLALLSGFVGVSVFDKFISMTIKK